MTDNPDIKIKNLIIKNFRAIDELNYSPKKINILIGKNNTGKSTILRAISFLFHGPFGFQLQPGIFGPTFGPTNITSPSFIYEVKDDKSKAQIISDSDEVIIYKNYESVDPADKEIIIRSLYKTLELAFSSDNKDKIQNAINLFFNFFNYSISINKEKKAIVRPYLRNPDELQKFFNEINKVFSPQQPPPSFGIFIQWIYGLPTSPEGFPHFKDFKNVFFLTHELKCSRTIFANEKELFALEEFSKENDLLPNLDRLTPTSVVTIDSNGERHIIPYILYGEGFIVLLNTLYYLLKAENGIVLIEEPENHLHPGFLTVFIETIFKYSEKLNIQIFMTSHSTDLIEDVISYAKSEGKENDILFSLLVKKNNLIEKIDYDFKKADRYSNELKLDLRGP
jgi:AAA15 family ATPase/GTPase